MMVMVFSLCPFELLVPSTLSKNILEFKFFMFLLLKGMFWYSSLKCSLGNHVLRNFENVLILIWHVSRVDLFWFGTYELG